MYGSRDEKMKIKRKDPTTPSLLSMDIKLQSFDPLDSSSHQTGNLLLHSFTETHETLSLYRRQRQREDHSNQRIHAHNEDSSWKSCKVETPRFGITNGAKVAAGKRWSSLYLAFLLSFLSIYTNTDKGHGRKEREG